jgi:hypothetical protein
MHGETLMSSPIKFASIVCNIEVFRQTFVDYLVANPFMQLWDAELESVGIADWFARVSV